MYPFNYTTESQRHRETQRMDRNLNRENLFLKMLCGLCDFEPLWWICNYLDTLWKWGLKKIK